jgi:hypothetical protein
LDGSKVGKIESRRRILRVTDTDNEEDHRFMGGILCFELLVVQAARSIFCI